MHAVDIPSVSYIHYGHELPGRSLIEFLLYFVVKMDSDDTVIEFNTIHNSSDQTVCSVEAMLESYHLLFSFKTISGGNTLFLNQNGYCTQILFTLEMNSNSIAKALVWDVNSSLVTCFQYYSAIVCRTCVNKQLVVTGCLKGCGNTSVVIDNLLQAVKDRYR